MTLRRWLAPAALCLTVSAAALLLWKLSSHKRSLNEREAVTASQAKPLPDLAQPETAPEPNTAEPAQLPVESSPLAQIAIIIDDLGHQWAAAQRAAYIQAPLTLAVLPFSPYAHQLATLATQQHKELMLHAPMEPLTHHAWEGGLEADMTRVQITTTLRQMLAEVPGAAGVNNHMGSALTQNSEIMEWVMQVLAQESLYFIDSRTSASTRALAVAQKSRVPSASRDIFLDNQRRPAAIHRQLEKLLELARKRGFAVAIGHPYPETLATLEEFVAELDSTAFEIVPASTLLRRGSPYYAKEYGYDDPAKASITIKTPPVNAKAI